MAKFFGWLTVACVAAFSVSAIIIVGLMILSVVYLFARMALAVL